MSIPERVIVAARDLEPLGTVTMSEAEVRARRVINALAGHLPESAIEAACEKMSVLEFSGTLAITKSSMRAALVAALMDIGGNASE